jgi:hypothetical protein
MADNNKSVGRPKGKNTGKLVEFFENISASTNRSGQSRGEHSSLKMTPDEMDEIRARRAEELVAEEKAKKDENLQNAVKAMLEETSAKRSEVARTFGVSPGTLKRHVDAVKGSPPADLPTPVRMGPPRTASLTSAQVKEEQKILRLRDLHKDSIPAHEWTSYTVGVLEKYFGVGAGGSKQGHYGSWSKSTVRAIRDQIAPEKVRITYAQNQARYEALAEEYHQIAFCIICRLAFGYLTSTSALGREPGEKPTRDTAKLYNADASQTYVADLKSDAVQMAPGSTEALKGKGRSAASTKKKEAPAVQRRPMKYFIVCSRTRMLAAVILLKDRLFPSESVRLFRSHELPEHFLVAIGPDADQNVLADRVMSEIVDLVIKEDCDRLDRLAGLGPVEEMGTRVQPPVGDYHIHNPETSSFSSRPSEATRHAVHTQLVRLDDDDEGPAEDVEGEKCEEQEGDEEENDEDAAAMLVVEDDKKTEEEGDEERDRQKQEQYRRPLFFLDGEKSFLNAVLGRMTDLDGLCFDLIKSGGSCTAFQQLLDKIKAFMQLHGFFGGVDFRRILELPDSAIEPNALMREWAPVIADCDPASRRTFERFFFCFPTQLQKHINEITLGKGWANIWVWPFNQRKMLEVVPSYSADLSDEQRDALDKLMPVMVQAVASAGSANASDELINHYVGHIIGGPRRGLSNDSPEIPPMFEPQGEDEAEEKAAEDQPPAKKAARTSMKVVDRAVTSLQRMYFDRWRASYFTPSTLRAALALKAKLIAETAQKKETAARVKREAKEAKEAIATEKKEEKVMKKAQKDLEKELGPRRKVYRPAGKVECQLCLTEYEPPVLGTEETWLECEFCYGRWWCDNAECKRQLEGVHEPRCRARSAKVEAQHQANAKAAPRKKT